MTEQEIERCLERLSTCKATDVMNFDYAGTLAYIKRLKSENAALRERVEKSVELPCKVGDIIYIITFGYNGKHVTPNNFADCWSYGMEEVEVTEGNLFIMCSHFRDGSAFFDRASAEARLAELKGGKYENF